MKTQKGKKDFLKNKYFGIGIAIALVFFTFFTMYRIVPMMYDGWAGKFYYPNINGILQYIKYICVDFYQWINGRIMSNIICGFLESFSSEIILDFFNAFVMVGIYLAIAYILKIKKGFVWGILLFMSMMLLISNEMRMEVLFYANTAYLVPVLLILLYYIFLEKLLSNKETINKNKQVKLIIILSFIGFSICTWMEHIAVGFAIIISLHFVINFIKKHHRRWNLLIPTCVCDLGVLIMFLSPGLRLSRTVVDENNTFDIIKSNISTFYTNIISENLAVFIILALLLLLFFIKNKQIPKFYRIPLIVLSSILLISMGLTKLSYTFNINISDFLYKLYPTPYSPKYLLLELLVILVTLFAIIVAIIYSKNKKILFYLLSIAIFSIGPMLITPNTGERISSIGFFIAVCLTAIFFHEITEDSKIRPQYINTILSATIIFTTIIALDKTILLCRRINDVTQQRNRIIHNVVEKQELGDWDYNDVVVLPAYQEGDILYQGITQIGTFHYPQFLDAYGLSPNTKVVFGYDGVAGLIKNEDGKIKFELFDNIGNTEYMYILQYSNISFFELKDIENSGWIKEKNYEYDYHDMKGNYRIKVYIKNGDTINELKVNYDLTVE